MKPAFAALADSRLRKVWCDARTAGGRFFVMGLAMALSLSAIVAILAARAVLDRELQRNFTDTVPASATLELDRLDEALLAQIGTRAAIVAAERRTQIVARIRNKEEWIGITLFVVPDFTKQGVGKFYSESGAWPPATNAVLLERSGAPLMPIVTGESLDLEMPNGTRHTLRIDGQVHDPGQAPSWQEIWLYGYVTPETLARLDPERSLDSLEVRFAPEFDTIDRIDAEVRELAAWLKNQGRTVYQIQIPEPNAHPHQWQIDTILVLLLAFGLLGLVLEGVLLAIIVAGVLAPQSRQVGVMKTVGARTVQIAAMYLGLIGSIALIAVLVAIPTGVIAGDRLALYIANLLNFEVANRNVPASTLLLCAALGLGAPLFASLLPIWVAARRSVRASIDDFGVDFKFTSRSLLHVFSRCPADWQLAFRNATRRKSRFTLSVVLLSLAGLVFILAGNLRATWVGVTDEGKANRVADLQVIFSRPTPESRAVEAARVAGVVRAEPTDWAVAYIDRGDGLAVSRADQSNLLLRSVPDDSKLVNLPLAEGRWLQAGDENVIVLNSMARKRAFPGAKLGDELSLLVNRKPLRLRLVGVGREVFGSATGYTPASVLDSVFDAKDMTRVINIDVGPSASNADVERELENSLRRDGLELRSINDLRNNDRSVDAHTYMLLAVLGLIVTSVALVGVLGLTSALSTSVVERTRELGVLRTIGARNGNIRATVIGEALLVASVSWLIAALAAVPVTFVMMKIMAALVPLPLPLAWSPLAFVGWLVLVLVAAAVAALYPAQRAARLTVRQAIAYH